MSKVYPKSNRDQPKVYQIRFEGQLGRMWADWFDNMTMTCDGDDITTLTGLVTDQAMLYRILRQVRDLGLPLVSVNRLAIDADDTTESDM